MKKSLLISILVSLLLVLFVSCNGDVDEKLFANHEHVYEIQNDGLWKCIRSRCEGFIEKTDKPYIATIENGLPSQIIPLTENMDSASIGTGTVTVSDTDITYTNESTAQEVVIRTQSGMILTINAPNDTVHHYNKADLAKVGSVDGENSYHEFGNVPVLDIKEGHVVLESISDVTVIHFTRSGKDADTFKEISIEITNSNNVPTFTRDSVTINKDNGTKVAKVAVEGDNNYIWLFQEGIYEQTKVSTENTADSAKWTNTSSVKDKTKNIAQQISNNISGEYAINGKDTPEGTREVTGTPEYINTGRTLEEAIALSTALLKEKKEVIVQSRKGESRWSLDEFVEEWNKGTFFDGFESATLTKDITIELDDNEAWTPIGTWEYPFYGTFDGDEHTITGLKANTNDVYTKVPTLNATVGQGETYGFFGIVGGGDTTIKNLTLASVAIDIEDGKNVGALIGYVPKNGDFTGSGKGGDYWGEGKKTLPDHYGTDDLTITNVMVSGLIKANAHVGGLVGKIYATGSTVKFENCSNKAKITETGTGGLAGFVGYCSGNKDKPTTITFKNCENTTEAKLIGEQTAGSDLFIADYVYIGGAGMSSDFEGTNNSNEQFTLPKSLRNFVYDCTKAVELDSYTITGTLKNSNSSTTMTVKNSEVKDVTNNGTMVLENVTVSGKITNNGTLTINSGIFNGDITNNASATLTVSGGTFNGKITNDGRFSTTNSCTATFNGIVTNNEQSTIKGGTFACDYVANYDTMTISGGDIKTLTNVGGTTEISGNSMLGSLYNPNSGTISIIGGKYKCNPSVYVADGYLYKYDESAKVWIIEQGIGYIECNNSSYESLEAAFEENGSKVSIKIKLLKNTTSTDLITASGLTVIEFELNGYNLTCAISAPNSVLRPAGVGKLTLTNGTGLLKLDLQSDSDVIVKEGVIINRPNNGTAVQIQGDGGIGTITIEGGTITGTLSNANGEIIIKGGTFTNDPTSYLDKGYKADETDGKWIVSEKTK